MTKHGGDVYAFRKKTGLSEFTDFSANISPLGIPESVKKAYINSLDGLVYYPDPANRKLTEAISEFHGISAEHAVCGNGGADIIYRTVRAVSPRSAVIPVPSFSEYRDALEEYGCSVTEYILPYPFEINDDFIKMLDGSNFDMTVICNPSNPTGLSVRSDILRKICEVTLKKNIVLMLDECFLDMAGNDADTHSLIPELYRYKNTVVVKSLTKMFAIPGLRVGYGIFADTELAEKTRNTGQPWSVSVPASEAGAAALRDTEYRRRFVDFTVSEREYLYCKLKELGFEVWKPSADFVFFRTQGIKNVPVKLEKYGICIRSCSNYTGLDEEYCRVCVRTREENDYLLKCLRKIVTERNY